MKPREETAKTIKFLDRILTAFFDLAIPDSTAAKPRFMKNTNTAANITQRVSIIIVILIIYTSLKNLKACILLRHPKMLIIKHTPLCTIEF